MRAFLAFELSEQVVQRLVRAQEEIAATRAGVKLVERENIHITVKFFGEISDAAVLEVDKRLAGLHIGRMPLVKLRGMGAFPNEARPRVLWAGLSGPDRARVGEAASKAISAVEGLGMREDRPYHPHVTLGRVNEQRRTAGTGALSSLLQRERESDYGTTDIDWLKLKSSVLTPRGPTYSDVKEYRLEE